MTYFRGDLQEVWSSLKIQLTYFYYALGPPIAKGSNLLIDPKESYQACQNLLQPDPI